MITKVCLMLQTFFCLPFTEKEFKVQTRIIQVDFGLQDVYANISSSLEGLEIGILGMCLT